MPDPVTRPEREEEAVEAAAKAIWRDLGGTARDWANATHSAVPTYLSNARAALEAAGFFDLLATLATTRRERDALFDHNAAQFEHITFLSDERDAARRELEDQVDALAADLATARRELEAAEALAEVAARYIEDAEHDFCSELHLDSWPECDDDNHDEGRKLAAALTAFRTKGEADARP